MTSDLLVIEWGACIGHSHLPLPGVVARRGVPGGLRGVGGGTPPVSLRSPADESAARWTSRTARRAASPICVCGRSASIRDKARKRSWGSVAGGRGWVGIMYEDSAVGSVCDDGGAGWDRDAREMFSNAKRRSRFASATRVVCSAEFANVCRRSTCGEHGKREARLQRSTMAYRILQLHQMVMKRCRSGRTASDNCPRQIHAPTDQELFRQVSSLHIPIVQVVQRRTLLPFALRRGQCSPPFLHLRLNRLPMRVIRL